MAIEADQFHIELWHHSPPGFHSPAIRAALGALTPCTDSKTKWPGKQISKPKTSQLIPLLHQAAEVYQNPGYFKLAK